MSKPNPFSANEAKDKILFILNDGMLELSVHCRRESMPKREVTMLDVVNALKAGEIRRGPEWDDVHNNWKYRVEGKDIDGDELIAITLIIESDLTLYIVTVF